MSFRCLKVFTTLSSAVLTSVAATCYHTTWLRHHGLCSLCCASYSHGSFIPYLENLFLPLYFTHFFSSLSDPPWQSPGCSLYLLVCFCVIFHLFWFLGFVFKWNHVFVVWLISHQHNTFKVYPCCLEWQDLAVFMVEYCSIECIYYIDFICSSFSGHCGCFQILADVNNAGINKCRCIYIFSVFVFFG